MRNATRRAVTAATAITAVTLPAALMFSGPAFADLTSGPVTVSDSGSGTAGTPYDSGQSISITVAANSTLNSASLSGAGDPGLALNIQMCAAPGGVDPTSNTGTNTTCDALTNFNGAANPDGSVSVSAYTVYTLPDNPSLGEGNTSKPACGLAPNYCVLYIGSNPTDFSKPKLFSAPFQVAANGTDTGANPGDGTPEVPLTIGLPLLGGAVIGGSFYLRRRKQHAA